jgi:hypothetical protein
VFFATVWAFVVGAGSVSGFAGCAGVVTFVVGVSASSAFVLCFACAGVVGEAPTFKALLGGFRVEVFFYTHGVAPAEYVFVVE